MTPSIQGLRVNGNPFDPWTIPLARLRRRHLRLAGAKAVSLGQLIRAGLPVPSGIVLTTAAFQAALDSMPQTARLRETLTSPSRATSALESLGQLFRDALASAPLPIPLRETLRRALGSFPQITLWAVRSSATLEDSSALSFAGQHDSFLNVPSADLPDRVRQCWQSLYSPRAIRYRAQNGIPFGHPAMAVILQEMIPADVAGVLFTADPLSHDTGRIVIEAARGLGENVGGGRITPERVTLAKSSGAVLDRVSGSAGDGSSSARALLLPPHLATRLADLAARAERVLPGPLDIEWAACGGQIALLQARPVTGKVPARTWADRQIWSNVNSGEVLPHVTTPITYFISAAAVVMDQGGILSHGSIVAREYGLPAVTNVGSATRLIRTGDIIRVDGTRGYVTIL